MERDGDINLSDAPHHKPQRQYKKPKLQEYGSIAKLTQSGGSTRTEAGQPMRAG